MKRTFRAFRVTSRAEHGAGAPAARSAAFCTTVSYYPQLKKCWATGSAGDLSSKTFITLSAGVGLWVVYGFLKNDFVIIIANAVSLALLMGILYFKLRDRASPA